MLRARKISLFLLASAIIVAGLLSSWQALDPITATNVSKPAFAQGNQPPVASAGIDQAATVGDTVVLDGSGSFHPVGRVMEFSWQLTSVPAGSLASLSDPSAIQPSFSIDLPGDYVAELVTTSGNRSSNPDSVTVSTVNVAPVADVGPNRAIAVGNTAVLDGTDSFDADGNQISYAWALVSSPVGSAATLDDPTASRPSFFVDSAGDYQFELVVQDGFLSSTPATVTLSTTNTAPTAAAGPDSSIVLGRNLQLDGSGSADSEGDSLDYAWDLVARPVGSGAGLSTANQVFTELAPDVAGDYLVQLVTDDGTADSPADTRIVTTGAVGPVADAGPDQRVTTGTTVTLDGGSSSDQDGGPLTYSWALISMPAGSSAALNDATAVRPSFTVDLAGSYVTQLTVSDDIRTARPDTVVISTENGRPLASAGPDATFTGGSITLDASASSDPDNDPLTYSWSILQRPKGGQPPSFDDPSSPTPTLTASKSGIYVLQVAVSDGSFESIDSVVLTAFNVAPLADAGADQVSLRHMVVALDGSSSSDANNDPLSFAWTPLSKPTGSATALANPTSSNPNLIPDLPGQYVVQLIVDDGSALSVPDAVVISAINQPPTADAGADRNGVVGAVAQLDGTGSSDPDNDVLTYAWSLISQPAGSSATLDDPTSTTPSLIPDVEGTYVAELVVSDGFDSSAPDSVTITVFPAGTNLPPILEPIGDQVVDLGSGLTLQLNASDANNDPLSYSASPFPLPANASLNGQTGLFTFTPDATQVGGFDLTFSVSDGKLDDVETITITVNGAPPGGVTAVSGRLLDTNDFNLGITTPVVGATVTLLGTAITTTSDANGDFFLNNLPADQQTLDVDSSTASLAPDGSSYASFREAITLIANVTNAISRPIFLPRIDAASLTTVVPTQTTVVTNPNINVSMTVPPFTAKDSQGNDFTGQLSISEVPANLAPVALPEELQPALLVSIQPVGVTFASPVPISFPNLDGMAAGNELDLYSVDPASGLFQVVGVGTVSQDGTTIETTSGGISAATWHMQIPPVPDTSPSGADPDNIDPSKCTCGASGSASHFNSGNLSEDHSLVSYRSLGASRSLRFVYNSTSADPRPVLSANATVLSRSAVPNELSIGLRVGGIELAAPVFTSTSDPAPLDDQVDEVLAQAIQFDARDIATGSYSGELRQTSHFGSSAVTNVQGRPVLINNEIDSPFGAGWTLAGFERLHLQANGDAVLTDGNGGARRYGMGLSAASFEAPVSVGSVDAPGAYYVADYNNDGFLDAAIPNGATGQVHVFLGDGQGTFPNVSLVTAGAPAPNDNDTISAAPGDFDNDGNLDLVVANQISDTVSVHLGDGTGNFAAPSLISINNPKTVAVDDFNGDGFDDFAVGFTVLIGTGRVTVFFGDGAGGFPTQTSVTMSDSPNSLLVADFNGDNAPDIAAAVPFLDRIYVMINDGSGGFTFNFFPTGPLFDNIAVWHLAAADFDQDGDPDIVASSESNFFSYMENLDGGQLAAAVFIPVGTETFSAETTDLDGDGNPDVVLTTRNTGELALILGDGQGGFSAPTFIPARVSQTLSGTATSQRLADFDGDGFDDILLGVKVDQSINLLRGTGVVVTNFVSPPGDFSSLVKNQDDSFTRRLKNGTEVHYDTAGRITSRVDRNGNATTYAYDGQGLLTTITDPVGLATSFAYSNGKLASVTDPATRVTLFEVDANGDLTRIQDPDGSQSLFAYDADHHLVSQFSKRAFETTYDFGFHGRHLQSNWPDGSTRLVAASDVVGLADTAAGQGTQASPLPYLRPAEILASFTDGNSNTTTYQLDPLGGATMVTDALSRVTLTSRNADSLPTQITRPNGRIDAFTYDGQGNLLTRTEAQGTALERTTSFEYEPTFNQVTKIIDPALNETTFAYDANGNLSSITDAASGTLSFTYNAQGLPLSLTDQNSNTTSFTYDAQGRLDSITDANTILSSLTYDTGGRLLSAIEAVGLPEERSTSFTYDALNRVLTVIDRNLETTTLAYDAAGNLASVTTPTGETQLRGYDERGRIASIDDPINGLTSFTYDNQGNLTARTDARNETRSFGYDAGNRVAGTTDALGGTQAYLYDANDNLLSLTDERGKTSLFQVDLLDRRTRRENPLGEFASFAYDSRDNLVSVTTAKGDLITAGYDALNRLTQTVTPDNTISFAYDPVGNLTAANDNDSALAFTYDGLNRQVTADTLAAGIQPLVTLTNSYNAISERVSLADSLGGLQSHLFDGESRLTQLTSPANDVLGLAYDPAGRLTAITRPSGIDTAASYDVQGRLDSLTHGSGALTLASFTHAYDPVGNVTSIVELVQTRDFAYDALERLTAGGANGTAEAYAYDALGNRTSSHLSASHVVDDANRLSEDDAFTYAYDLNGNLISKTAKVGGALTTYSYDAQDQLIRIDLPGGSVALYAYDGLGRRIEKDVDGAVTAYVYDGADIALEFDGAGALLARYSHGDLIDQPLTMQRGGQSYFYHTDHLGSIRLVTDAAGAVVNSYDYDAYGNFEAISEAVASPYAYTGREYDGESDLYYVRARYYDPQTGRFLSEDPIAFAAGDPNLYRYVFNNPTNLTDPSGEIAPIIVGTVRLALEFAKNPAVRRAATAAAGAAAKALLDLLRDNASNSNGEGGENSASGNPADQAPGGEQPGGPSCGPSDPDGIESAAERADEIHSVLDSRARRSRTTAVTETQEGVRVISSSERRLTPAQRAQLRDSEIEGVGLGHAEVTGIRAARGAGLTPTGTAASRPICSNCADTLRSHGVKPLSSLK